MYHWFETRQSPWLDHNNAAIIVVSQEKGTCLTPQFPGGWNRSTLMRMVPRGLAENIFCVSAEYSFEQARPRCIGNVTYSNGL
jgi:hypothetical protein